ncbi:hypothetical protein P5673_023805 [Acropora cervicornis]|uniref:Uncharacterized protein n=1 Tax=Acropora cervicornis TaxID=6130 RepID=A0AAD9Q4H4_ACRCE|nr:hypothetical protein P5673_023805 [Acropora cervicornis]
MYSNVCRQPLAVEKTLRNFFHSAPLRCLLKFLKRFAFARELISTCQCSCATNFCEANSTSSGICGNFYSRNKYSEGMFITVKYGDHEEALFNPNCRTLHLLEDIKRRCNCPENENPTEGRDFPLYTPLLRDDKVLTTEFLETLRRTPIDTLDVSGRSSRNTRRGSLRPGIKAKMSTTADKLSPAANNPTGMKTPAGRRRSSSSRKS